MENKTQTNQTITPIYILFLVDLVQLSAKFQELRNPPISKKSWEISWHISTRIKDS